MEPSLTFKPNWCEFKKIISTANTKGGNQRRKGGLSLKIPSPLKQAQNNRSKSFWLISIQSDSLGNQNTGESEIPHNGNKAAYVKLCDLTKRQEFF